MSGDDSDPGQEQQDEFNQQQAELQAKNKQIMMQKLMALKRSTPGTVDPSQPTSLLTGQDETLGGK